MKRFKWKDPDKELPEGESIVLVETREQGCEYDRLCTAIFLPDTGQWFEMLNTNETGSHLMIVTAWSHIPEMEDRL